MGSRRHPPRLDPIGRRVEQCVWHGVIQARAFVYRGHVGDPAGVDPGAKRTAQERLPHIGGITGKQPCGERDLDIAPTTTGDCAVDHSRRVLCLEGVQQDFEGWMLRWRHPPRNNFEPIGRVGEVGRLSATTACREDQCQGKDPVAFHARSPTVRGGSEIEDGEARDDGEADSGDDE